MAIAPLSAPQVASVDTQADAPSAADTTQGALAQAKAPTTMGKGAILGSLPVASAAAGISPELLTNMQQMITEREAKKNSFMESLKDANAWWSGGMAGPGEALRARAAEREGQDATTFGMKSALAQYKAAQDAAQGQYKSLKGLSPGQAGGAPGAPAAGKPMPIAVQQEFDRLLSLSPPNIAGAQAIRDKWLADQAKFNPEAKTQKEYFINGKVVNLTPEEYDEYKRTKTLPGEAPAAAPASVVAPGTVPTSAPTVTSGNANIARDAGVPVISGYRPESKQAELLTASQAPGYKGPPVAAPGQSLHQTDEAIDVDYKRLKPEQKNWLKANGYVQTMPDTDPNHFAKMPLLNKTMADTVPLSQQRAEVNAAKTSAPVASELPYPKPSNSAEVKANEKYIEERTKKELEIISKGPEKAGTEAGTRQAQMYKLNEDADATIKAADQVIAASKSHPEAVGLGKGMTASNILTTIAGVVVPKMTKEKAEEQYADLALGKEASVARSQINTASKQLGISFAADVFKGARMGIGLENMAANAKGVSEHNRPENNIINATLIKEAALFNKARAQLFDKWKETHGGRMADFEKFETSPEYNVLKEQSQKRISESLPDYLKIEKGELVEKNPSKSDSKFDKFKK